MEISLLQQAVGFLAPVGLSRREGETGGGGEVAAAQQEPILSVTRSGTRQVRCDALQSSGIVVYQLRYEEADRAQLGLVFIKSTRY